jgi:tRNA N6-adenosine threonylcarbamoyltransferase
MYTLGIETSCDETSCAILKNCSVLSNITISSLRQHKRYGGVVPEIATRAHLKYIDKVVNLSMKSSGIPVKKIDLIAVTHRPGLVGALVVGLNFAKALSVSLNRPYLGVNHLYAHLFGPFLNNKNKIKFPFLGVVVSGGHTVLYKVDDFDKIKIIGQTRDDACGEVFDKISVNYGFGYPGGPVIDKLFDERYKQEFSFNCGRIGFDLSFSGIKTALIYKKNELEKKGTLNLLTKKKLLSSFQYSVFEKIISVILDAAAAFKLNTVVCGGGVIANSYLRKRLSELDSRHLRFYLTSKEFSGDNAAIVAGLGFYLYNKARHGSSINLKATA